MMENQGELLSFSFFLAGYEGRHHPRVAAPYEKNEKQKCRLNKNIKFPLCLTLSHSTIHVALSFLKFYFSFTLAR